MSNLSINFSNPWFLLLLLPAIAFALIPYFRMDKRYRKTRNRITSIVLHITVMVLSISVLAGITFEYDTPNEENEVIILVDTSESGAGKVDDKNDFIKNVIDNSDSMFKLGIVKFGYDQVYAVELTNNTENMYVNYLQASMPDNSATDIAAALNYAATLFSNKNTARIVLLSDAVETDGNALNTIKNIAAEGIKVDTVSFPNEKVKDEVQIIGLEMPKDKIKLGEEFTVKATIQSSFAGSASIVPSDNNKDGNAISVDLIKGVQTVSIPYTFELPGLHILSVNLSSDDDTVTLNNSYTSFLNIQSFDKILIIESIATESESLRAMLGEDLKIEVVNVRDPLNMPKTLNALRAYDQIILCNISNADMPLGFADMLYSYVHDYGGGLFTVCGNKEDLNPDDDEWEANAYTYDDMKVASAKKYRDLLPVEIIEYTPPAAVVVIIDRSGSMEGEKFENALKGAESCIDALTERDFLAIMSLGDDYSEEIDLTPVTNRAKILAAIQKIEVGGNTEFYSALEHAGKILGAKTGVEKRHIIIVTDGEPTDKTDDYKQQMKTNAENGITTSIVGIGCYGNAQKNMIDLLKNYAGMTAENFHSVSDPAETATVMRKDLEVPAIKDVNYETFKPTFGTTHIITSNIEETDLPTLDGYYGVKAKEGAVVILQGKYTPIYTQWKCGEGTVGTFACDLNGVWSTDFINSEVGALLINNIVQSIFPTSNVQPSEIDTVIDGENYSNVASIFTDLEEGQYIELTIKSPMADGSEGEEVQSFIAGTTGTYSRISFSVKTPGLHTIIVEKKEEDGTVIASTTTYKALSYSKEYDLFYDEKAAELLINDLATFGHGSVLEDPIEVFENAVKYIHHIINPKIAFIIIALVLLLLDIAARKFKWKWPHELIREKKEAERMHR